MGDQPWERREPQQGLIVRQKSPLNLEYPISNLSEWTVPNDQFFVRSHFTIPEIEEDSWRLRVHGLVERPLDLSLADVRDLAAGSLAATIECAGNGRVFYVPAREGLQWQSGAVGNAVWSGVPLRALLELAGVQKNACEAVLVGADHGVIDGGKKTSSPGPIAFARSLPMATAMGDGALLAYEMNGELLTPEHGFPLRAVVGGWFGMAWVKWLTEIRVVERPFLGYWQARDYFAWDRSMGEPTLVPLSTMAVKSVIARPVSGAVLLAGRPVRIFGAAWGGEGGIERLEVSTDGGASWERASLLQPEQRYAWRLWEYSWTPAEPGRHSVLARATDCAGNSQPDGQQPDRESYVANWMAPMEVKVVASREAFADEFVI